MTTKRIPVFILLMLLAGCSYKTPVEPGPEVNNHNKLIRTHSFDADEFFLFRNGDTRMPSMKDTIISGYCGKIVKGGQTIYNKKDMESACLSHSTADVIIPDTIFFFFNYSKIYLYPNGVGCIQDSVYRFVSDENAYVECWSFLNESQM
jgi:hypothetical protein